MIKNSFNLFITQFNQFLTLIQTTITLLNLFFNFHIIFFLISQLTQSGAKILLEYTPVWA